MRGVVRGTARGERCVERPVGNGVGNDPWRATRGKRRVGNRAGERLSLAAREGVGLVDCTSCGHFSVGASGLVVRCVLTSLPPSSLAAPAANRCLKKKS